MLRYALIAFLLTMTLVLADDVFAQIEYSESVQPIFSANCTACHGGTNGVTLSSYDAAMNSVGVQYGIHVIQPGEPDESPLVDKISNANPQFGVRMPQGGPYLSSEEIETIRQWIEEGALETVETSTEVFTGIPEAFRLIGNYPNPFNPSTVIRFETPVSSQYQLSVYSIIGRQIHSSSGIVQAGQIDLRVDLSSQPSGVYLYRIDFSGSVTHTLGGRMTLVK